MGRCFTYLAALCIGAGGIAAQSVTASTLPALPTGNFINNTQNGEFTWPSGATGIFNQGSPMGIRWESPYNLVNIYYIWNQTVNKAVVNQCQIVTGAPGNMSYDWEVNCAIPPNCNTQDCGSGITAAPYVLHIVDADPGGDDRTGFWSREFYIQALPSSSSSSATSTSTPTSISTGSTSTTVLATAAGSDSSTTSPPAVSSSSATQAATSSAPPKSTNNSVAIGVGVGVGVGGALLLAAGAFFLWRRRGRDTKHNSNQPPPSYPESNSTWGAKPQHYGASPQTNSRTAFPAEAPARDPQEMEARGFS
ncbi:hypothetical protein LTR86_008327 [Recurvomyces mirabilis]|nr:hypothetical protein LTR86_008327 [Recurvomyces mirabilis]